MAFDYTHLFQVLEGSPLKPWLEILPHQLETKLSQNKEGHLPKWLETLQALPSIEASELKFDQDCIQIGHPRDCDEDTRKLIEEKLRTFLPWRKGPYSIHSTFIDTEWQSDWKWKRLAPHIRPLKARTVLDIGCGNGYHLWRMLGEQAELAIGIDPFWLYVTQYEVIRHFTGDQSAFVLPLSIEELTATLSLQFDSVFSMGVLYHRRSPIDHLMELRSLVKPNGELVLETLVVDGNEGHSLFPQGRYAKMRNVWFIPTCATLEAWLKRCGFKNVKRVSLEQTSTEEQRATDWMRFESLSDYLDSSDPSKTVEGYPRPLRAIFVAS